MAYFVIAGKSDCPAFAHVVHVANYLEDHLPNFNIRVIQKKEQEKWAVRFFIFYSFMAYYCRST